MGAVEVNTSLILRSGFLVLVILSLYLFWGDRDGGMQLLLEFAGLGR